MIRRPYRLLYSATAARALAGRLPEKVAAAVVEFCNGDLLDAPRRVGKRLHAPLDDIWCARRGSYRVLYKIDESQRVVLVLDIDYRGDIYRRR